MTGTFSSDRKVRKAAAAGRFYPSSRRQLARDVEQLLAQSVTVDTPPPRALIAPHAGYVCSAIVAAAAFRTLTMLPATAYTVFLLGPAHYQPVHGVGLSSAEWFETPLGLTPVATDIVRSLADTGHGFHVVDGAHIPEHSLEVEVPFLQFMLTDFRIVPLLFDGEADPLLVAESLLPNFESDENSLLVVSSDLSHYSAYDVARSSDLALLDAIERNDVEAVRGRQACGLPAILTLMAIAGSLDWRAHVVDYRNSGDTCGPRDRVVGYGAVVYSAD